MRLGSASRVESLGEWWDFDRCDDPHLVGIDTVVVVRASTVRRPTMSLHATSLYRRRASSFHRHRGRCAPKDDYWLPIEEPTLLNVELALVPTNEIATMQTTAMRATRSAYSTSVAPRSLRANRFRMNGLQIRCQ
jgi:hypothetical protein